MLFNNYSLARIDNGASLVFHFSNPYVPHDQKNG